MIRAPLSTTSVLDETTDVVSIVAAPWIAILVLTSLPYRLLQIVFLEEILELGTNASHYGTALLSTANFAMGAFAVSILGRAIYARAVSLAHATGQRPGREVWRLDLTALLGYLFIASFAELLFYATWFSVIAIPLTILVAGVAAGTSPLHDDDARFFTPLRRIARHSKDLKILTALLLVFTLALLLAMLNLSAVFGLGLWLAEGFGAHDLSRWSILLNFTTRRFVLLLIVGAIMAIEPFWIAANVVLVRKSGAEESGEELRIWFRELVR